MRNKTFVSFDLDQFKRFKEEAYNLLVRKKGGQLLFNPEFQEFFNPYSSAEPYPLDHIGNYARVCSRYQDNWINKGEFIERLKRSRIGRIFGGKYLDEEGQFHLLTEVLYQIGADSYTTEQEWSSKRSCRQIDSLIEQGTGITHLANRVLARSLEERIGCLFKEKENNSIIIMDLGPGTGNTIIPLIEMIDKLPASGGYAERITAVLVDGQDESLDITQKRLKKTNSSYRDDFRYGLKNVVRIKENFGRISDNYRLINLRGKIDLIISGAAILHTPYKRPMFSLAHSLLKKGGVLAVWDFYFKTFLAPSLKEGKEIGREIILIDKNNFERSSYLLAEDEPLPRVIREKQGHSYQEVIGLLPEKELAINFDNLLNWLYLFGYLQQDGEKVREQLIGKEMISERLHKEYWQKVRTGSGFNFIEDFLEVLPRTNSYSQAVFSFIESYGDDYADILRQEGFIHPSPQTFTLGQMMENVGEKKKIEEIKKETILFTYSQK